MPTDKTERFSQMPEHTAELTGAELMVVSKQTVPKKTHNATTATFNQFITTKVLADNVTNIVSFNPSIKGTGKPANPLQLDGEWLSGSFFKVPTNLSITSVGDRNTRYLPISRKSLFSHNYIELTTKAKQPPVINLEPTGELRIVAPGKQSTINVSYGRWSVDKDLKSEQIIERGIRPTTGLPNGSATPIRTNYDITEIFGTTATGTLAIGLNKETNNSSIYYYPLKDASLAERGFGSGYLVADGDSELGLKLLSSSCAIFTNSSGTYLMVLPQPTSNTAALEVEVYTVMLNATVQSALLVPRGGWATNSYVGLFTNQSKLRLFDTFMGASTAKVALVNDGTHSAELMIGGIGQSQFINVQQDPSNIDDITFYYHGYARVSKNGGAQFKYCFDIIYKLNLTATAASVTAIPSYLGAKPTLTSASVVNNRRNTITANSTNLNPEYRKIIQDGSVVAGIVNGVGGVEGMSLYGSISGVNGYVENDLHANIAGNKLTTPLPLNYRPGYTGDLSTVYKLYIASPIQYLMGNGGRGVITPRILDLSAYAGNVANLKPIQNLPYIGDKYRGLNAWAVHLYIQHTGATGIILASSAHIQETENSTYFATVWFLEDNVNSILTHQAFSRLYKHRPSYRPRGMSVPVSYSNPALSASSFWMTQARSTSNVSEMELTYLITNPTGQFVVPSGYRARIWAVGGGGGGGGNVNNLTLQNTNAPRDGFRGGDTQLSLSPSFGPNTVTCGGGGGGIGGIVTSPTVYGNGAAGDAGVLSHNFNDPRITAMWLYQGIKPPMSANTVRQLGGAPVIILTLPYTNDGHGGYGAWGTSPSMWGYGGGGGSAAGISFTFTNINPTEVALYYKVGAAGAGRKHDIAIGNSGVDGGGGFILVELEKL